MSKVPFKLTTLPHADLMIMIDNEGDQFLIDCINEYIDVVDTVISLAEQDYIPDYVRHNLICKLEEECAFALWTMQYYHEKEMHMIEHRDAFLYYPQYTKDLLAMIMSHDLRLFSRSLPSNNQ